MTRLGTAIVRTGTAAAFIFASLGGAVPLAAQQPAASVFTTTPAADSAREARLAWFRDARYGLFIHWGLYAIPAGQWKGKTVPGIGEWIMNRAKIPVTEYEQLATQFNPTRFSADEWEAREGRRDEVHRHHRQA